MLEGKLPAPGSWTIEIAKHLKMLAPHTLVLDGSFAKSNTSSTAFDVETLESPHVDLVSYHYYGSQSLPDSSSVSRTDRVRVFPGGDALRVTEDVEFARKYGKVLVAECAGKSIPLADCDIVATYRFMSGEYGFLEETEHYGIFLQLADEAGCAGTMVWSLRPHAQGGGFRVRCAYPETLPPYAHRLLS